MARIVFYATRPQSYIGEITRIFSWSVLHSIQLEMARNHSLLANSLTSQRENTIVILAPLSAKEIDEFIVMKELFSSMPIIIILPDNYDATFQSAMILRPVYFTTIKDDICYLLSFIQEIAYILNERNETSYSNTSDYHKIDNNKPMLRSRMHCAGADTKCNSGRLEKIQRSINAELRFP